MGRRRIRSRERRARLGRRHRLALTAGSPEEATADVVALHSSDPSSVYLSGRARVRGLEPAGLEDALYERRSLVRMQGMRRTLFVTSPTTAAAMNEACTKALAPAERRRLARWLEEQGVAKDGARWVRRVERATLAALDARGPATARELTEDVPGLGAKLRFGEGTTWAGTIGVSTRILFLLATDARVLRARPLGTWISGQYRWARTEAWLGGPLRELDHGEASAQLLTSYLRAFGPATEADVRWWAGWTAKVARATLAAIGAVEVPLEEGTGFVLPDDLEEVEEPDPWVALLPGLDPTVMGWKERDWYLGSNAGELFDRNGNAGPTVWADGRVVGGWSQTPDGRIEVELIHRVDARTRTALDAERERLREWFGQVRITPRFRTPLERRLSG